MDSQRVKLNGGAFDGMMMTIDAERDVLLLPTNKDALIGRAAPTAPHFSEYRRGADHPLLGVPIFEYVGDGVDAEAEEIPSPKEIEQ